MKDNDSDSGKRRRIGPETKAAFVEALRAGITRDEAAAAQGFTSEAFYCARKRDPLFRLAWIWAGELTAIEEREERVAAEKEAAIDGSEIVPNNRRLLQRRRKHGARFTDRRKQLFLDHFAGTADLNVAAEVAGVHISTVYKHFNRDPVFAEGCDAALRQAYALLEAEAVRQRLEAQRRAAFEPSPTGEIAREFDRVMQLLARYERRNGRIGQRAIAHGRQKAWTFEEAITALDKKLTALGAPRSLPPPEAQG